jgi:hypothetical protein
MKKKSDPCLGGPAQGLSLLAPALITHLQGVLFADDFGCFSSEVTLARSRFRNIAEA